MSEEKVRQTLAEFCHVTDAGNFASWVSLFTVDGTFHVLGRTYSGHEALRSFIELDQRPERRGLHLTTDSVIRFGSGGAEVMSKFIFVAAGDTAGVLVSGGTYHDILVPCGERWLFRDRECSLSISPASQTWGAREAEASKVVQRERAT